MIQWILCHILRQHCEHVNANGVSVPLSLKSRCRHSPVVRAHPYTCCRCSHVNYYYAMTRGGRIFNFRIK